MERVLRVRSILLDFSAFPYITHSGSNIAQWIVNVLAKYGCTLKDIRTIVPDGASNGIKALRMLHVAFEVIESFGDAVMRHLIVTTDR